MRPLTAGSSPRGRGKPDNAVALVTTNRLIPAWAGKTVATLLIEVLMPAHPRVGGENRTASRPERSAAGSSPRGRGKRTVSVWLPYGPRLIPAWAGKTPDML